MADIGWNPVRDLGYDMRLGAPGAQTTPPKSSLALDADAQTYSRRVLNSIAYYLETSRQSLQEAVCRAADSVVPGRIVTKQQLQAALRAMIATPDFDSRLRVATQADPEVAFQLALRGGCGVRDAAAYARALKEIKREVDSL